MLSVDECRDDSSVLKESIMKASLSNEDLLAVVASTTHLGIEVAQDVLRLSRGRILLYT